MKFSVKKMKVKKTGAMTFFITLVSIVFAFSALGNVHQPTHFQDEKRLIWNLGHTTLSLSGSYRLRAEFQDEFNIKDFGTGQVEDFLLSRLRLETDLRFSQRWRLHFQLQDARVFGSSFSDQDFASGNNPFHDPLDINQGYIEGQLITPLKIKIGRQAISLGDRRIFGPGDWGNTGRYAWDAAIITLKNQYLESNFIIGRYIRHNPDRWPNKWVEGPTAFANYNSINNLPFLLDVFYVFKYDDRGITVGEGGAGNLASHSLGLWLTGKWQSWEYGITAVGQLGKWSSDDIRAYGLVGSLGYQWPICWQPLLKLQCIIGSGDRDPNDGIHGTFDGVFSGADTNLYGWMNMFFWQNLQEYRVDFKMMPIKALTFKGEFHYFMLDEASDAWYFPGNVQRRDETGSSVRYLGQEIDCTIQAKVRNYLTLLTGYCFFIPGEFIKNTGKGPVVSWYFLETDFYF